jgi:hypothetical protein
MNGIRPPGTTEPADRISWWGRKGGFSFMTDWKKAERKKVREGEERIGRLVFACLLFPQPFPSIPFLALCFAHDIALVLVRVTDISRFDFSGASLPSFHINIEPQGGAHFYFFLFQFIASLLFFSFFLHSTPHSSLLTSSSLLFF